MATNPSDTQQREVLEKRKVFNDPIHGHIDLHPVCVRIIDTPQFQRLRHIKQLDACYLVYPGASHNRFEHSLGTCHLAGKLMRTIKEHQPDENITEKDILCVEIAGLCHDLGQGPFSHVFEKRFMPQKRKHFKHERAARKMFEYILEANGGEVKEDIKSIIAKRGIPAFDDEDFLFIKEMIDIPKDLEKGEWPYHGRREDKSYMYEIVANKRNGIDVDKWDYLARDSYMLGMKVNFDHNRCFMSARVLKGNGCSDTNGSNQSSENGQTTNEGDKNGQNGSSRNAFVSRKQICNREKDAQNFYDMFYTRMTLHRRAYQHKTHRIIGVMICDALLAANDCVKFYGKDGKVYSIADAVDDMEAYSQLTDDVFQTILFSPESIAPPDKARNFKDAKQILNDVLNRRLFKIVTETQIKGPFDEKNFKEVFKSYLQNKSIEENSVNYDVVELDYGMKNRDPMEKVRFYEKDKPDKPIKVEKNQVSFMLPETYSEKILRIYQKVRGNVEKNEQQSSDIRQAFAKTCKMFELPLPKGSHKYDRHTTEVKSTQHREPDTNRTPEEEHTRMKLLEEPIIISSEGEGNDEQ